MDKKTKRLRYYEHKGSCKDRFDALGNQIEFKLTYEEWEAIWENSGHIDERGCKAGQYVMSRINDIGHYEVGNVFIQSRDENIRSALCGKPSNFAGHKHREESKKKASLSHTGKIKSEEHCRNMSIAAQNRTPEQHAANAAKFDNRPIYECPHCKKMTPKGHFTRWHNDNCKFRKSDPIYQPPAVQ
jgi:hypothetical protein